MWDEHNAMSEWDERVDPGWDERDDGASRITIMCERGHQPTKVGEPILFYIDEIAGRRGVLWLQPGAARDNADGRPMSATEVADLRRATELRPELPLDDDLLPTMRSRRTFKCPDCGLNVTLRDRTLDAILSTLIAGERLRTGESPMPLGDLDMYRRRLQG